ncbi:hypothetical protein [Ruegeria sp. HKCCD6109]|uniref:hypothetical protein n=1 Tax=Ruegeria sp. HKCCD6109 TaxID=2683017 RepID=UPI0014910AF6|nr:hypothetical protein [Ruegeria sp. HKCCD6109]NOD65758.1 hypothetical protein [Ruegeria sp. HKCCD6109]
MTDWNTVLGISFGVVIGAAAAGFMAFIVHQVRRRRAADKLDKIHSDVEDVRRMIRDMRKGE